MRAGGRGGQPARSWRAAQTGAETSAISRQASSSTSSPVGAAVGQVGGGADDDRVRRGVGREDHPGAVPDPAYPAVLVRDPGALGQPGGEVLPVLLGEQHVQHGGAAGGRGERAGAVGAGGQPAEQGGQVGGGDQVGDAGLPGGEVLDAPAGDAVPGPAQRPRPRHRRQPDLAEHDVGGQVAGPHDHPIGEPAQRRGAADPVPDRVVVVVVLGAGEPGRARQRPSRTRCAPGSARPGRGRRPRRPGAAPPAPPTFMVLAA